MSLDNDIEKKPNHNDHDHDHDHDHHGHDCDHHHHDHHEDENHSVLGWAFSKAGADEGSLLQRHRGKVAFGATSALAAFEYGTIGATTMSTQLAMVFGAAILAHDSSEDLMDAVEDLKDSHGFNSGVIGLAAGAAHTASEFAMSAFATTGNYSDMVVATTMGSNVSHIPLMTGMAAMIGAVSIDKFSAYKMNSVAMGAVTGAFGYQIATGDFNPYLSAGMIGVSFGTLLWRVQAGQTCVNCSSSGQDNIDPDLDPISISFWRDAAKKLKVPKEARSLGALKEGVKSVGKKLSSVSLPSPEQISTTIQNIYKGVTHSNIATAVTSLAVLGGSAHILGNNVVKMAEQGGMTTTAMGATVAALAFVLPELILTGKAALKNDGEMAWGAITGCTIATVGIVGGYQGLSGFDIPSSLDLAITEGKLQMAAFVGSAATIIAATHPKIAGKLAKIDNAAADRFEERSPRVANWLRNDGSKISKVVAAPMFALALSFYAAGTLPICHSHGNWVHCLNKTPSNDPLPSADEVKKSFKEAMPQLSGPDF